MFSVGIDWGQKNLDAIKKEIRDFQQNMDKNPLKLKLEISNLDTLLTQLQKLGNSNELTNLRSELQEINRQFLQLSKGAGGTGDLSTRGLNQMSEAARQAKDALERAEQSLARTQRTLARQKADPTLQKTVSEADVRFRENEVARLKGEYERLASASVGASKQMSQGAENTTVKIEGLEVAIRELSNKTFSVNMGSEFKAWAEQVQALTTQVRDLIEQFTKLNQVKGNSGTASQSNLFDPQKFTTLQEAIDRIVTEINRLRTAFEGLGNIQGVGEMNRAINGIQNAVNNIVGSLTRLNAGLHIDKSTEEIAAWEAKIKALQTQYEQLAQKITQANEAVSKSGGGGTSSVIDKEKQSLNIAQERIHSIINLIKEAQTVSQVFGQSGFDTYRIDNFIQKVMAVKDGLDQINKNGGTHPATGQTASQFLSESYLYGKQGNLKTELSYYKQIATEFERIEKLKNSLSNILGGITDSSKQAQVRQIINDLGQMQALITRSNTSDNHSFFASGTYKTNIAAATEALKQNTQEVRANEKANKENEASVKRAAEAQRKSVSDASAKWDELGVKIRALKAERDKGISLGLDVSKMNDYIQGLARIRKELLDIMRGSSSGMTLGTTGLPMARLTKEFMQTPEVKRIFTLGEEAAKKYGQSLREASAGASQLSEAEQRLANVTHSATDSMRQQSQVLSDLKMMATQYLSVWGAQSFLNKIIETGGQLEQQRLSMGAILQDAEKADEIFGQIKKLAVKSPFGVVQLDQMSKQLAAYSFESEELFEWTKRLADISAATGTEVSRLSLALGHVRSEGALSGYTLRQFSMGNVPLLQMLSESRGVSKKEIRQMVRGKQISADEVMEALEQLTNEGGMFYNAQEVMSQALNAKFKNLRDSFDIMYGEMAESGIGDFLKMLAENATEMSKHWQRMLITLGASGAAFMIARNATAAFNARLGAQPAQALKAAQAATKLDKSYLKMAKTYRQLTYDERAALISKKKISAAALSQQFATQKLSQADLERMVAMRKVDKQTAIEVARMRGFNVQAVAQVKQLSMLRIAWMRLGGGIAMAGKAIASFGAMMAKYLLPMIALGKIINIIGANGDAKTLARDTAQSQATKMFEKYRDVDNLRQRIISNKPENDSQKESLVSEMTDALKEAGEFTDELKQQVDAAVTTSDKYDILRQKLIDVSDAYQKARESAQGYFNVVNDQGRKEAFGFLKVSDGLLEDAKDLSEAQVDMKTAEVTLNTMAANARTLFERVLKAHGDWKDEYSKLDWKELLDRMNDAERKEAMSYDDSYLARALGISDESAEKLNDAIENYFEKVTDWWSQWRELEPELKDAFPTMVANYTENFDKTFNLETATEEQKKAFAQYIRDFTGGWEEVVGSIQKMAADYWIKTNIHFEPEVDLDEEEIKNQLLGKLLKSDPLLYGFFMSENAAKIPLMTSNELKKVVKEYQTALSKYTTDNIAEFSSKAGKELEELQKKIDASGRLLASNVDAETKSGAEFAINAAKTTASIIKRFANYTNQTITPPKHGSQEDKKAKELREYVRILKEAEQAYQYWRKAVGEGGSTAHVKEEFGQILDEKGYSFENIRQYKQTLTELRAEYQRIYDATTKGGKKRPQLLEALKEIDKVLADIKRKDFEKATEDFVSAMTDALDRLTRQFEIYNSVAESTGDRSLAARLSGVAPGATTADLKRANVASFAGVGINFESVLGMSDREIDEYVQSLGVAEDKIKAVQNGLKDWKKAQQDVTKSDIQNYAKWLGSLVDIQSIYNRNQEEYNRILEETNRLRKAGIITQEEADRRNAAAAANKNQKNWQAGSMYHNLYNNSQAMASGEFYVAYYTEMAHLDRQLKNGTITLQDYADKVGKLNKIESEFGSRGFLGIHGGVGAFLAGGSSGLAEYHRSRANKLRSEGRMDEANEEDKRAKNLERSQKAAEQLVKAFQDLSNQASMLANMFDALGMEGAANAFGDTAGVLGGIAGGAQSLSTFGPYGMAAGAIIGGITSFAQLNDKVAQRHIDALKDDVSALEANTNMLKQIRERSLGYDGSAVRNALAAQYSGITITAQQALNGASPVAARAMASYYGDGSKDSYAQELSNLQKMRDDYIDMYNWESDKKKSSKEALLEYQQKIAELDDKIMNFTEDLANSLWGIDIKGWADQFTDAIVTAWENGEDAAKAFDDTVSDVMRSVVRNMLKLGVVEPLMAQLREKLFGANGAVVWNTDAEGNKTGINWEASQSNVLSVINDALGDKGYIRNALVNTVPTMMDAIQNEIPDIDLKNYDSSSAGNSIKSITEQQADLLLSYLNAIRLDVSVDRGAFAQYLPLYYAALIASNASLRGIELHAQNIAESNAAIRENTREVASLMNGLRNREWRLPFA